MKIEYRPGIGFTILLCLFGAYSLFTLEASTGATLSFLFLMVLLAGGFTFWLSRDIRRSILDAEAVASEAHRSKSALLAQQEYLRRTMASVLEDLDRLSTDAGRETVHEIERVSEVVSESATIMKRLGISSRDLGQFAKMIGEIADQTNLLALNAKIEATRSHDQGRGFAVVADEMCKQADRTANATRHVKDLVEAIRMDTGRGVETIETGLNDLAGCRELASRTGRVIELQADEIRHVLGAIGGVSTEQPTSRRSSEPLADPVAPPADGISGLIPGGDGALHRSGRHERPEPSPVRYTLNKAANGE